MSSCRYGKNRDVSDNGTIIDPRVMLLAPDFWRISGIGFVF